MPTEVVEHASLCLECSRLMRLFEDRCEPGLPPGARARIQSAIMRDLKPVRPLAGPVKYLLASTMIVIAVLAVATATSGNAGGWNALSAGQRLAVFAALAVSGALATVSLIGRMSPGSKEPISPGILFAGVPVVLAVVIALMFGSRHETEFVATGAACFRSAISYSIASAIAFGIVLRRGTVLRPGLTGLLLGGLAGLIGLCVLEIKCADLNSYHILVWHGGVVVASSIAGGVFTTVFVYGCKQARQSALNKDPRGAA